MFVRLRIKSVLGMTLNCISAREYGVAFYCHYSQVHSDLEWLYLLGSYLWVKLIYLKIIHIQLEYLMPYNHKLFVLRIVT